MVQFSDFLELSWLTAPRSVARWARGFGKEVGVREAAYAYHPERDAQDEGPDSQD
ncbi:MAG: hypothetical protein WKF40_12195 [Thermoleophilaceae bacterium]